jgi:hypothetical protein
MNKNTKMILGVGAVAIVGYLVYKQMSKPKAAAFANLVSSRTAGGLAAPGCPCGAPAADQSGAAAGWVLCAGNGEDGKPDKMCRKVGGTKSSSLF